MTLHYQINFFLSAILNLKQIKNGTNFFKFNKIEMIIL